MYHFILVFKTRSRFLFNRIECIPDSFHFTLVGSQSITTKIRTTAKKAGCFVKGIDLLGKTARYTNGQLLSITIFNQEERAWFLEIQSKICRMESSAFDDIGME